jgi:hypothetical protein
VEAGSSEQEIDEARVAVKAAEPSRRSGYTEVQRRHSLNICELGWNVVPAGGIEFSGLWADAEYKAAGCDVAGGIAECLDSNSINSQRISERFGTGW